jgi:hypothetical protein
MRNSEIAATRSVKRLPDHMPFIGAYLTADWTSRGETPDEGPFVSQIKEI